MHNRPIMIRYLVKVNRSTRAMLKYICTRPYGKCGERYKNWSRLIPGPRLCIILSVIVRIKDNCRPRSPTEPRSRRPLSDCRAVLRVFRSIESWRQAPRTTGNCRKHANLHLVEEASIAALVERRFSWPSKKKNELTIDKQSELQAWLLRIY